MRFPLPRLAALLLAGTAPLAHAIPGPELLPSPQPFASPDGRQPDDIRVGQAADGRSVIAFVSDDRLYLQRLAADGSAAEAPTAILQTGGSPLTGLSLAVGANGHYTVGAQVAGDNGLGQVFIRRYQPDGTRLLAPGEPDEGPLPVIIGGAEPCIGATGVSGMTAQAVAVDAAGNTAYTFARTEYCPSGRSGALQPVRTRLFYRYAPVAAPASDPVPLFEQSIANAAGFPVDVVNSAVALQDDGSGLVTWVGHPESNQTPATYVRPVQLGLASGPAQRIEATNSFDRDAPVIGAKTGGYVLNWRGDFNDPETGGRRLRCYVQARALDGSAQFEVQTVPGCGRHQIVQPDGRFELIASLGVNLVGRRYSADGVETGSYSGGSRPNRFLDRIASAWSPRLVEGNYLAIYNVEQPDGSRALLEPVSYGGPEGTRQLNLELNPAGPLTVSDGRTVMLFWTSNAPAGSCFGFGNLGGPLPSSGSRVLGSFTTAGTRNYGVACGPGALSKSVTLEIVDPDAVTVTVSWNPPSIVSRSRATVSWNASNADSCAYELSGALADTGSAAASGAIEYAFPDPGEARFDLNCTGPGGRSGTASAAITIGTPRPLTVTAAWSPASIDADGTSTLNWSSENAAACTGTSVGIADSSGLVDASGSLVFQPGNAAGSQAFTLECIGVDGERESTTATLTVNPVVPTVTASWVSPSIRVGETPLVMWSSTRAIACEARFDGLIGNAPFAVDAGGMSAVTLPPNEAGVVDFTLSCVGAGGGRASTTARLTVNAITPTVSASWVSPTIRVGETPFVMWSSTDAIACQGSFAGLIVEGPFAVEASGLNAVSLPSNTAGAVDFTLDCVGPGGGRAVTTARLTVNALPPPPPLNLGSIVLSDGRTVQLVSSAGAIVNTRVTARPAVLPAGFTPVTDFLAFDITNIPVGGSVEVTLTLPAGVTPNGYVKCTPDCALFDRAVINGNQVRLALTDGGAGDADGVADGVIRDPGAPGTVASGSGGGGAAGGLLPLLGLLLMIRRRARPAGR